jgi:hypothetical protein
MFLGILVKMNWKEMGRHNSPHFHAFYGEDSASFTFGGEIISGSIPNRQAAYVKAWALLHEEELRANWALAVNGEDLFRIDPLK